MLNNENAGIIIDQEASDLRKAHDAAISKRDDLLKELRRIDSELEQRSGNLKRMKTGLVVSEKRIKDFRNDIFFFNRNQTEIDEAVSHLVREIEEKEAELAALKRSKKGLIDSINGAADEIRRISDEIRVLKTKHHETSEKAAALKKESDDLGHEIDHLITKTSKTVEEFDSQSKETNQKFINITRNRKALVKRLNEQMEATRELKQTVDMLEQKDAALERLRNFKNEKQSLVRDFEYLEKEVHDREMEFRHLQEDLAQRKRSLDAVTHENADCKASCETLAREVGKYNETLGAHKEAQEIWNQSGAFIEQGFEELKGAILERSCMSEYVQVMREIGEKLDRLVAEA